MHDVHSATVVSLKRHLNTFGVVTPTRTYYLQAGTSDDCTSWVKALNEVRNKLRDEDFTPLAQTPRTSTSPSHPTILTTAPAAQPKRTRSGSTKNTPPNNLPAIVTSSPTPDELNQPFFNGRQYPQTPTSPVGLSSDDEDPFIASQGQAAPSQPSTATTAPLPLSHPPLDPNQVIISGYLMKCGSKRKAWHKRWFMLTGDRIAYSKSHIDMKHMKHVALEKIVDAIEYTPAPKHGHHSQSYYGAETQGRLSDGGAGGLGGGGGLSGGIPSSAISGSSASEKGTTGGGQPSSYVSESAASAMTSNMGSKSPPGAGFSSSQPSNTFKIITTQRPFLLSAPSEEEEIRWLSAVRALIARRTG